MDELKRELENPGFRSTTEPIEEPIREWVYIWIVYELLKPDPVNPTSVRDIPYGFDDNGESCERILHVNGSERAAKRWVEMNKHAPNPLKVNWNQVFIMDYAVGYSQLDFIGKNLEEVGCNVILQSTSSPSNTDDYQKN